MPTLSWGLESHLQQEWVDMASWSPLLYSVHQTYGQRLHLTCFHIPCTCWRSQYITVVVVQSPSCVSLFATLWTVARQASLSLPSPRVCPGSCSLNRWLDGISSSVTLFSFCLQSFPASGSFPMSWLFTSGDQGIGASASVLPVSIQGWFPLEYVELN